MDMETYDESIVDRTEHRTNEDVLQMVEAERVIMGKKKVKEAGLYSAYTEVPYTQGAQVRITQCYLQTTPVPASTS